MHEVSIKQICQSGNIPFISPVACMCVCVCDKQLCSVWCVSIPLERCVFLWRGCHFLTTLSFPYILPSWCCKQSYHLIQTLIHQGSPQSQSYSDVFTPQSTLTVCSMMSPKIPSVVYSRSHYNSRPDDREG